MIALKVLGVFSAAVAAIKGLRPALLDKGDSGGLSYD
jgi:hypothetical protein